MKNKKKTLQTQRTSVADVEHGDVFECSRPPLGAAATSRTTASL